MTFKKDSWWLATNKQKKQSTGKNKQYKDGNFSKLKDSIKKLILMRFKKKSHKVDLLFSFLLHKGTISQVN